MDQIKLTSCVLFALAFYGSPGPATLSLAASGAMVGFWRSIPYLVGIVSGLCINFLVTFLGLAVLLERMPSLVRVLQYVSLAYVIFLATRMLRFDPGADTEKRPLQFREGVLLNLLNPKAYLAAVAVLSQFANGEPGATSFLLFVVVATGLTVDIAWCYGGSLVGDAAPSPRHLHWIRTAFATLLVATALFATFWS